MPDVLIRDMPAKMKQRLAARAKASGRSLSAEIKATLDAALQAPAAPQRDEPGLGTQLAELFKGLDWDSELVPPRDRTERPPPVFS
ncbi:MAG: Arc family DNA-binding protein [Methylobacteriaceae bacterium]|nr:Arc family DNA-binding protein [Methylobacteriaceae bacterium]